MIIACPACNTRYAVPDSSIGVDGRTVRCAKCRHSWFQEGPALETRAGDAAPPPVAPAPVTTEPRATEPPAASVSAPSHETLPAAEPRPAAEPVEPDIPPPPLGREPRAPRVYDESTAFEEAPSTFDHEPPFRRRRNPAKMWMAAALIFAVVALGAVAAVAWYGLPNWMPLSRQTFASAQPDLVLDFPANRQDRRTLPNGSEFFGASGTVTNVGRVRQSVPTVLIVLRDARNRVVYSWEAVPSKRELGPGESVTINEAVTDVPKSAKFAEIGWKPA